MKYRPEKCKTCGGKKMQPGGINLSQYYKDLPMSEGPYEEPAAPSTPMNSVQDMISKGILDTPKGYDSPEQWYSAMGIPKPKHPLNLQNLGIALQAGTAGFSWLSGIMERGRKNQYRYSNNSTLGQLTPVPTQDYQPTYNNSYSKMGGNIKSIFRGMQNGGPVPKGSRLISKNVTPPSMGMLDFPQGTQIGYPGDSLTDNQLSNARQQYHSMSTEPGADAIAGSSNFTTFHNFRKMPLVAGFNNDTPYYYMPSDKDSVKLREADLSLSGFIDRMMDNPGEWSNRHLPTPVTPQNIPDKPMYTIPRSIADNTAVKKNLSPQLKSGGWLKDAVNPAHKGYCTPMTKSTCTGHRRSFALMMKKNHGFHKK